MDKRTLIIIGVVVLVLVLAKPAFAVKSGATVSVRPEIISARNIIAGIWRQYGYTLTVTSGTDSVHSSNSLHYQGLAEDYRTSGIPTTTLNSMLVQVRLKLGNRYDVILESDHLHVEYDP